MDYSKRCYEKTALSQAIVRLDFRNFIETDMLFQDDVINPILDIFPNKNMRELVSFQTMNLTFNPNENKTERTVKKGAQQKFLDNSGNCLVLTNMFVAVEINRYTKFDALINKLRLFQAIFDHCDTVVSRTGIRYINLFGDDTIRPQKRYFKAPVSALATPKLSLESDEICIRSMNLTEFQMGDMRLNFRYGQYNPAYPQPINRPHFVLDFDCYYDASVEKYAEIEHHIDKGHDAIQRLFEDCISDALRRVMGDKSK